jgi:pSer/pThr/pTyr-binding forkhead associated (FHA) protein
MDALTRCENGHYYDSQKHSSCPFCGVQNLDIDIKKTMAKRPNNTGGVPKEDGSGGKTVGVFRKKLGIDPVVGWLVAIEGPEKGNDYRITSERNFIGRSEKMDISIPGDDTISRENHAIVSYNPKNNSFRLFLGESRGLVYLNDDEVITPVELNPYDQIEIGETKLKFVPFCGEQFRWKDKDKEEQV